MMSRVSFAALFAVLISSEAFTADIPLYEYQWPESVFREGFGGTYHLGWDEACKAAASPPVRTQCSGSGGYDDPVRCNTNPKGESRVGLGDGCSYDITSPSGSTNVFYQNWAIPVWTCPSTGWTYESGYCKRLVAYQKCDHCPDYNPVYASNGSKIQGERDVYTSAGGGGLTFTRVLHTDSLTGYPSTYGTGWGLERWGRALTLNMIGSSGVLLATRSPGKVSAMRADAATGVWVTTPYEGLELSQVGGAWQLIDKRAGAIESYDASGRLTAIVESTGAAYTLTYSDASTSPSIAPAPGLLISVTSSLGPRISLTYDASKRLASAGLDGGLPTTYAYDVARPDLLTRVQYADGTYRTYLYEPALNPMLAPPPALSVLMGTRGASLGSVPFEPSPVTASKMAQSGIRFNQSAPTGILDEIGQRYATYQYDTQGRVLAESHGSVPAAYSFNYVSSLTQTIVTDLLGSSSTRNYSNVRGSLKLTSQSQGAGAGCSASTMAQAFDVNGNVSRRDDFSGNRACFAYNLWRNLEASRIEGLAASQSCDAVLRSGAALPTGARKVSVEWHPDWALETLRAEPGKVITKIYNGQPDPFNGSALAACAPANALLPDGKPIAVLCKQVEQATYDATGARGLSAAASPATSGDADPYASNVSLMLHMEGPNGSTNFIDSSPSTNVVSAVGSVAIGGGQGKFGGGAVLGGIGDYLTVAASPALDAPSGDLTVEAWVRINSSGQGGFSIVEKRTSGGAYAYRLGYTGSKFSVSGYAIRGSWIGYVATGTTTPLPGVWYHVAFARQGGTVRLFVNGALEASTPNTAFRSGVSEPLLIGVDAPAGLNGQVDEVRITKGVARYAASFTAPNAPSSSAATAGSINFNVPARIESWTYNQRGQVLTHDGPRTDVNDTTTYVYYNDTTVDHTMGDVATVTNAAGKVTQYTKYNKYGQVLESIDPNGVLTVNTYDLRQRLLSSTVGGQTTSYSYDPVGQLKRVTLPDQSWIGYDYDDAHRQVAVYDHKGNRVDYQLDNAGNRIGEQTKDPGGALKRQLSRSIDALGRVQQTTGRE